MIGDALAKHVLLIHSLNGWKSAGVKWELPQFPSILGASFAVSCLESRQIWTLGVPYLPLPIRLWLFQIIYYLVDFMQKVTLVPLMISGEIYSSGCLFDFHATRGFFLFFMTRLGLVSQPINQDIGYGASEIPFRSGLGLGRPKPVLPPLPTCHL